MYFLYNFPPLVSFIERISWSDFILLRALIIHIAAQCAQTVWGLFFRIVFSCSALQQSCEGDHRVFHFPERAMEGLQHSKEERERAMPLAQP